MPVKIPLFSLERAIRELGVKLCGNSVEKTRRESRREGNDLKCHMPGAPGWLVKHLTSAQVIISQFVSSSPLSGSGADSSEPGACFRFWGSVSPFLCPSPTHALCLSQKQYTLKKIFKCHMSEDIEINSTIPYLSLKKEQRSLSHMTRRKKARKGVCTEAWV